MDDSKRTAHRVPWERRVTPTTMARNPGTSTSADARIRAGTTISGLTGLDLDSSLTITTSHIPITVDNRRVAHDEIEFATMDGRPQRIAHTPSSPAQDKSGTIMVTGNSLYPNVEDTESIGYDDDQDDQQETESNTTGYSYSEEEDSSDSEDENDEWEETLLYLDLKDIPNVEELFAVQPDDFLMTTCPMRGRENSVSPKKPTYPRVDFQIHNFDSECPILQVGNRYYEGSVEEPFGTCLFFRQAESDAEGSSKSTNRRTPLTKLTEDMNPPPDPVFGTHLIPENDYEMVAKAHKVIRMTRRNLQIKSDATEEPPGPSSKIARQAHEAAQNYRPSLPPVIRLSSFQPSFPKPLIDFSPAPTASRPLFMSESDAADFKFKRPKTPPIK